MKKVYLFNLLFFLLSILHAQLSMPNFSHARGYYGANFQLTISSNEGGVSIYYTTDGSDPSPTNGSIVSGNIPINGSSVVRARAFAAGQDPSPVASHTYIFLDDVLAQPYSISGWPNTVYPTDYQGNTATFNYEMDPAIVNDPQYSSDLTQGFSDIPTVCLAINQEDFWETNDQGKIENQTSVEILYPNNEKPSEQADCIIIGMSHTHQKRSLRLEFKSAIGPSKLESNIMDYAVAHGGTAAGKYDHLVLRAGTQRSWARNWVPDGTAFTRDQWYRDAQIAVSGAGSRGTYVHLYVNSVYFGLYNITERPNTKFLEDYFGGEDEQWYAFNHNGDLQGDPTRWEYLAGGLSDKDMSIEANYEELKQYLNVEQFIDYLIVTWMTGMVDWPGNNFYGGNRNEPTPEPLMFFGWDCEQSWDSEYGANTGAWVHKDFELEDEGGFTIAKIFNAAKHNTDFMMLLADRVYKHCFNDGPLTDDNQRAHWAALNNFIYNAVVCESARWGDGLEDGVTRTRNVHWQNAVNHVDGVMDGNVAQFMSGLYGETYYPTIDPPTWNQIGGEVDAGFELNMTNPNGAGTIYYRMDGGDPREDGGNVAAEATVYSSGVIINSTSTIKARVKSGNTWSALQEGTFVISTPITDLFINEFMASNDADTSTVNGDFEDWIEIYNAGEEDVNLAGLYITDDLGNPTKYQIPFTDASKTTVPAGGFLFLWADEATQLGANHVGIKLSAGGEDIGLVQVIGGETVFIDQLTYGAQTTDISYGRFPDGSENFEVFTNTTPNYSNSSDGPPPGTISDLFINELLASNNADITDPQGDNDDWIELYNGSSEAIDIGGLYMTDDLSDPTKYQIPDTEPGTTTIPAGGFLILWADDDIADGVLHLGFKLGAGGEAVGLVEMVEGVPVFIDQITFGEQEDDVSFGRYPDGSESLESFQTTTPGAPNMQDPPTPITTLYINEFLASNDTDITDPQGDHEDWIEIYNAGSEPVDIGGLYITDDLTDPTQYQIPNTDPGLTTVPAGGFLLLWADNDTEDGVLHVGIKLGAGGEQIGLYQMIGEVLNVVDTLTFGAQETDVSTGRLPDGGPTFQTFSQPTPGASNVIPNMPPVIEAIANQSHEQGSAVSLAINATDPEGNSISFEASGLPDGLAINIGTGEISGTISAAIGVYPVTVTATDNGDPIESSSINFDWEITEQTGSTVFWLELECPDVNPGNWTEVSDNAYSGNAYLTSTSGENLPAPFDFSEALRYDIKTSEAGTFYIYWRTQGNGGHNSIWYWTGSVWAQTPDFSNSFGWQKVGQIALSAGNHSLYFAKREGVPIADKMYVGLTDVAPSGVGEVAGNCEPQPNEAPSITPIANQSHAQGSSPSLQIIATDPNGDNLIYAAIGLPTGLNINANTGSISGTITASPDLFNVQITVTDDGTPSLQDVETFTWEVTEEPPVEETEIWVEAECVSFGSDWSISNDGTASNNEYLGTNPGFVNSGSITAAHQVNVSVNVSATGTYNFWMRFQSGGGFNSIWQFVGGVWVKIDVVNSTNWSWVELNGVSLSVGNNTLTIAKREGVNIDKFVVSSDNGFTPVGIGIIGDNCGPLPNQAPNISPIANQSHDQGETVSLFASATDPEGNNITYEASGLPDGITINALTGEMSGTITAAPNTYNVTITATDDGTPQESDEETFSWTITLPGSGPETIWLEAECVDFGSDWAESSDGTASNGSSLLTASGFVTEGNITAAHQISVDVNVGDTDTYKVWMRIKSAPSFNSIWQNVNGSWVKIDVNNYSNWTWVQLQNLNLTAGLNTLLLAKREGVEIDKFVVSNDGSFSPGGIGTVGDNCPESRMGRDFAQDELNIHLYPNPTDTDLSIVIKSVGSSLIQFRILDMMGRQVKMGSIVPTGGETRYQLSTQQLTSGVYYLEILQTNKISRKSFSVKR